MQRSECNEPVHPHEPRPHPDDSGLSPNAPPDAIDSRPSRSPTNGAEGPWPYPLDARLRRRSTKRLLAAMAAHGRAPIRNPDLVQATAIPRSDVSKIVHLLAAHGLATIEPDPRCQRRRLYRLTDLGHLCAIDGRPPGPATADTPQPPHHGPCLPGRDCNTRLARPATHAILAVIDRVTAPCITPHALTQTSHTSPARASGILESLACDGFLAPEGPSSESRARIYRLTPLGQGWLGDGAPPLDDGQQQGTSHLDSTDAVHLIAALREWPTNPATTTIIQQHTRCSRSTVTGTLQLLIHRGLIASQTTRRNRLQHVRPTTTGQSWLVSHATSAMRDGNSHRVEATQRNRVVAAIMSDLSASPPAWPTEMPATRELAHRYQTSDATVRDAEKVPEQHGVLVRVPAGLRSRVHRIVRPITTMPSAHATGRSGEAPTVPHPQVPTSPVDGSPARQAEADRNARYPNPAEPSTHRAIQPVPAPLVAGLHAPLPALHRDIRALIAFGPPHVPITEAEVADRHGADPSVILEAMTVFAGLGAVTQADHPTLGMPRWLRRPSWTMPASGLAFRAMVIELARRVDTGWYQWTGLNGATYQRPFPTMHELTQQFRTSQRAACQAIAVLHQLTYLRAVAVVPANLDSVAGHQLLQRHHDASLVIDAQQLQVACDAMPHRWFHHHQFYEVPAPPPRGRLDELVPNDVGGQDPWAS